MKFYKCDMCGNMMEVIEDRDHIPTCCNKKMRVLESNNFKSDEHYIDYKIIPITEGVSRVRVSIGKDDLHPSNQEHYIRFISIKTNRSHYTKFLKYSDKPCASFFITDHERLLSISEYCNLHGLYRITME